MAALHLISSFLDGQIRKFYHFVLSRQYYVQQLITKLMLKVSCVISVYRRWDRTTLAKYEGVNETLPIFIEILRHPWKKLVSNYISTYIVRRAIAPFYIETPLKRTSGFSWMAVFKTVEICNQELPSSGYQLYELTRTGFTSEKSHS